RTAVELTGAGRLCEPGFPWAATLQHHHRFSMRQKQAVPGAVRQKINLPVRLPSIWLEAYRPRVVRDCRFPGGNVICGHRAWYGENGHETNQNARRITVRRILAGHGFSFFP